MTPKTRPRSFFLVPGFSQAGGAWSQVIDAAKVSAQAVEIPTAPSFVATARTLAAGRAGAWAGYSLGGRLALQIALDYPDAVEALVVVSASPGIPDPQARAQRRRDDEALADWIESHDVAEFLDRWLGQPMFAGLDQEAARRHRLQSTAAIAHQLQVLGQGAQHPLWDRLEELDQPVVVVAGAHDEKYASIARRAVAAIGPNADLHIVPGAGHSLLQEKPDAIAGILSAL